jgi:hypothetical protein
MPKKRKKRTYEDYRELGSELYTAKKTLIGARMKAQDMFGKSKPESRKLDKVLKYLGAACALLSNREDPSEKPPTTRPHTLSQPCQPAAASPQ